MTHAEVVPHLGTLGIAYRMKVVCWATILYHNSLNHVQVMQTAFVYQKLSQIHGKKQVHWLPRVYFYHLLRLRKKILPSLLDSTDLGELLC